MKYLLKTLVIILISIKMLSISHANSSNNFTLNCKMTKYDIASLSDYTPYGLSTVKSFIPSNYILHFTQKGIRYAKYKIDVLKNTNNKIYFQYIAEDKSHIHDYLTFRPIKHIFFKKTKKLNVSFWMFEDGIEIWGDCYKETINHVTNFKKNTNKEEKVLSQSKISSNKKIKTISNSNKKINKFTNKTIEAEDKCTEIGFKKGTEEYGKCVLKLLELK